MTPGSAGQAAAARVARRAAAAQTLQSVTLEHDRISWPGDALSLVAPLVALLLLHSEMDLLWASAWIVSTVLVVALRLVVRYGVPGASGAAFPEAFRDAVLAASGLLEGGLWAAVIWFVEPPDATFTYAFAALLAGVCFCRLNPHLPGGIAAPLSVAPALIAEALVLALRQPPYAAPVLCGWVLLGLLGMGSHLAGVTEVRTLHRRARALEAHLAGQRALLNSLSVGVLVTRAGLIEDCNDKLLELFGYERCELIGQHNGILLAVPHDPTEEELGQAALLAREAVTRKTARRRRDESLIDVEVTVDLIEPASPDSPVVSLYEDITERLQIERELRLSRERLRLALDALQSGVWDVDLRENRWFYSRQFKGILGMPEEQRITATAGRLFFHHERIHPEDRAPVAAARMALLLHGEPFDAQYRVALDGRSIWVRETVLAQLDDERSPYRFTGSITDTTSINAIQERLRASEAFHRNLIDASNAFIWSTDLEGVLTFVNERGAREMYGFESRQMLGRPVSQFVASESQDRLALALVRPLKQGAAIRNLELAHITSAQRRIYVSLNAVPMLDALGRTEGVMGVATDITHLKKRERAFQDATRLQRLIFDSAGEGIVLVRNQRIYRANQAFADLVGATIGELVARPLAGCFVEPEQWETIEAQLSRHGNVIKVEQQLAHTNGARLWASVTGRCAEMAEHGSIYIWVFADISATKAQEEQSWYRANHDELTGLPNRRLLHDSLEQLMARTRREAGRAALLMLDLDGFKAVNDAHGHAVGDDVLKEVAHRLADNVRALDIAARLGGDEFVVVLHEVASLQDVEQMAQRLIDQIGAPVRIGTVEITIGASIGIALFPETAGGIAGLLQCADMAMYAAKAKGRGCFHFAAQNVRAGAMGRTQDV